MTVCADLGQLPAKTGSYSDHWGVPKVGPSRIRRRERRSAERTALAAAGKVAAEKTAVEADAGKTFAEEVVAGKVAAKASDEEVADEKVAAEKAAAEKVSADKAAAERVVSKKVAAEKVAIEKVVGEKVAAEKVAAEKIAAENVAAEKVAAEKAIAEKEAAKASTSCCGSGRTVLPSSPPAAVKCCNCDGLMSPDHQCKSISPASEVKLGVKQPAPLPLCLYCCHEGSGDQPVHYFQRCLCDEIKCVCQCYCTESQVKVKRKHFPHRDCEVTPLSAEERAAAHAFASAQDFKFYSSYNSCTNTNCSE